MQDVFSQLMEWHYRQPRFAARWLYGMLAFSGLILALHAVAAALHFRGVDVADPRYGMGVYGAGMIGMSMIILLRPVRARSPMARLCRRCSHVLDPDGDGEPRIVLAATCPSCSADLAAPHAVVRGLGVWRARVAWPLLFWGLIWLAFFVFLPE